MRLATDLAELVEPVAVMYGGFPVASGDDLVDFEVRAVRARSLPGLLGRQANVLVDGRAAFAPFLRRQAPAMFEWAINSSAFTRPNQYLLLHSAVVERGGHGLLLSGRAGSGKSTLTAALMFGGWRLLSDEMAVVPPGSRTLLPLPRPVNLKDKAIDIVRLRFEQAVIGPVSEGTRKGSVAHVRPTADSVARAAEPASPRWVVFPRFVPGAMLESRRVSPTDALLRLGREGFNYSMLGAIGFETLARLVDGCECRELTFGDLDAALRAIEECTR
jgi:HprK-related kinase A